MTWSTSSLLERFGSTPSDWNDGSYPPEPIVWLTAFIDTVCVVAPCSEWREFLSITPEKQEWIALRVPPISENLPSWLSFSQFLQEKKIENDGVPMGRLLYEYGFQTTSTALSDLTTPTALFVLVCLVVLLRILKSVLLPRFAALGRWAGHSTHGSYWQVHNEARIAKFAEYLFRLCYHGAISAYGIWYFKDKEWWTAGGTHALFRGFPHHEVQPGMAWYYLLQAAYNFDAMLSLLTLSFTLQLRWPIVIKYKGKTQHILHFCSPISIAWSDTVRGDFKEMMIHHIITNMLVVGSSWCRFTRIGSMVFLVHDISDVPVDLSKLANFLKWKWTTLGCFLSMVAVWLATRLYILPFLIYRSILTESHFILETGVVPTILYIAYRHAFYALVGLLILLHLFWFVMFLQIFATFLKKNECHDLSEHKAGEEQLPAPPMSKDTKMATTKRTLLCSSSILSASSSDDHYYREEKKDN